MKEQQPDDIDFFDELDLALSGEASKMKPARSFHSFAKESDFQSSESVLASPFPAANEVLDTLFVDDVSDDAYLELLLEDVPDPEHVLNHGKDLKAPHFPNHFPEKNLAPEAETSESEAKECAPKDSALSLKSSLSNLSCHKESSSKAPRKKGVQGNQGNMQRERRFACEFDGCDKRFFEKSKLKRHQVVHTKEKNHKCPLCRKPLGYQTNIKAHLRIHTGEKPFKCSIIGCSKSFAQDSNRKTHEKTHLKRKRDSDVVETDVSIPPSKR